MANLHFQVISDLHLETPIQTTSYTYFSSSSIFPLLAPNLFLLGDIGLVLHSQPLLSFLRSLLTRSPSLKIFYVMGNHEPHHTTLENAVSTLESWEGVLNAEFGERFYFLNRRKVNINERITVLGCTLWTKVPDEYAQDVTHSLTDLSENGIWNRSLADHNANHKMDLAWLNAQVKSIEEEEPRKEIVILTHHSPTTDPRANDPRFPLHRPRNSGFRTDLSGEVCWMSSRVKVWCFGHTHFSCQFVDVEDGKEGREGRDGRDGREARRKLVVANQKGYAYPEGMGNWQVKPVVVGREKGTWEVIVGEKKAG